MEKIFYKLIYDKRLKRSISILEMLNRARNHITIKELVEELEISKKTVLTTLEYAASLLPPTLSLIESEKGIKLHNEGNQSVEVAIIDIAKKTLSYQIIEHAFYNLDLNINDLADKIFVSESTIRVRIKHMNKTLNQFGLKLSYYSVTMTGDEANIRYFYYTYFSEFQELYIAVCDERLQYCNTIYNNLRTEISKSELKRLNYNYQQIARWLLITRERMELGEFVKIKSDLILRIKKRRSYSVFRRVYENEIAQHIGGHSVPEAEIIWAYIVSFNTIIYMNNENDWMLFYNEKDNALQIEKIKKVLAKMLDIIPIQNAEKDEFLNVHTAYLLNMSILTELSSVFQLGNPAVKKFVLTNNKSLYSVWFNCLSKLEKNDLFELSDINSISVQLAMITTQFCKKSTRPAEKVLFSFEGESGVVVYLEAMARKMLPAGVEAVFIYDEPITTSLVEKRGLDLLVHNYELAEKINGCRKLRMSFLPQIKEWTSLRELLIDLGKEVSL